MTPIHSHPYAARSYAAAMNSSQSKASLNGGQRSTTLPANSSKGRVLDTAATVICVMAVAAFSSNQLTE